MTWRLTYKLRLEIALRLADAEVSLPYWDSTLDSLLADPKDSILWTDELMGSTDENGTVQGDFSNWKVPQVTELFVASFGGNLDSFQCMSCQVNVHGVAWPEAAIKTRIVRALFSGPPYVETRSGNTWESVDQAWYRLHNVHDQCWRYTCIYRTPTGRSLIKFN